MYAFIHIPKTAGSAVRHLLRTAFGPRHCDIKVPRGRRDRQPWIEARDLRRARLVYPWLAGICGHRVVCFTGLESVVPDIGYFTFLRDPVRRFISHFHHFHRGRTETCTAEDVLAFASHPDHRNVQTRWISGGEDPDEAIALLRTRIRRVGLTEDYLQSLVLLRRWVGLPSDAVCPAARNLAKGKAELPYFEDPRLLRAIREANRADLEVYTYAQQELWPRLWREAGPEAEDELLRLRALQEAPPRPNEALWSQAKRSLLYKPLLHLP